MSILGKDYEDWVKDNASFINTSNFIEIVRKLDDDFYNNRMAGGFIGQERFIALLAYSMKIPFTIKPEGGIEIQILVGDLKEGAYVLVCSLSDIKNYDKINSLPDDKLRKFMTKVFSKERDLPFELAEKMLLNAKIDRSFA